MADATSKGKGNLIPFIPGDNNYTLRVPLNEPGGSSAATYLFVTRWNSSDNVDPVTGKRLGSWYFDLFDERNKVIAIGVKVVLGVALGRTSVHPFFSKHYLKAIDTTGKGKEAGFDELGGRVQVVHLTSDEIFDELTQ